jgi:hypothetical protein
MPSRPKEPEAPLLRPDGVLLYYPRPTVPEHVDVVVEVAIPDPTEYIEPEPPAEDKEVD